MSTIVELGIACWCQKIVLIVLRAFHITTRAFLVLASVFWALIALELIPALIINGMEGAREKLVHIWAMNRADLFASCQDSLQLLHEGYTDLLVFVMLTWAAVEVNRFLQRPHCCPCSGNTGQSRRGPATLANS